MAQSSENAAGRLTVLVTGATSGIGKAVAEQYVALGHRVFGTTRNPGAVSEPVPGVSYVRLDNADYDSARECAETVGDVDILVNNAGESHAGTLEETPIAEIERMFAVNVFGALALTQAVLPRMRERRTGTIVLVGSMLSSFPVAFRSTYSATKSALKAYGFAVRREVAPFGIRVVVIEPGTIDTGIGDRRSVAIGDDSPYRAEYDVYAAGSRKLEAAGIPVADMAERIVAASLKDQPAPFYAHGNRAGVVFALRRLAPRQLVLDLTARTYGLAKIRPARRG